MSGPTVIHVVECRPERGLGHLRRQLVLADALTAAGATCKFALTTNAVPPFLEDRGLVLVPWDGGAVPAGWDVDIIVVDGIDDRAERIGPRGDRPLTVVFDDLANDPVAADVIVNHNVYGRDCDYSGYGASKILAGPQFALIDSLFRSLPASENSVRAILISFGGTDDGQFAVPMATALRRHLPETSIHVALMTATRATQDQLRTLKCEIFLGRPLADAIQDTHLYVGAAGVSLLETASLRLTPIVCAIVPNQILNIEYLRRNGFPAFDQFDASAMALAAIEQLREANPLKVPEFQSGGPERLAHTLLAESRSKPGTRTAQGYTTIAGN